MTWRSTQVQCWYRAIFWNSSPGICPSSAFAETTCSAAFFQQFLCVCRNQFDVLRTRFCARDPPSRIQLCLSCDHPASCAHRPAPAFSWQHLQRCDRTVSVSKHSHSIYPLKSGELSSDTSITLPTGFCPMVRPVIIKSILSSASWLLFQGIPDLAPTCSIRRHWRNIGEDGAGYR